MRQISQLLALLGYFISGIGGIGTCIGYFWGTYLWLKKGVVYGFLSLVLPWAGQIGYALIFNHKLLLKVMIGSIICLFVGWAIGRWAETRAYY